MVNDPTLGMMKETNMGNWFVLSICCVDCGTDPEIYGPYTTEKEAARAMADLPWRGRCSESFVVQPRGIEKCPHDKWPTECNNWSCKLAAGRVI